MPYIFDGHSDILEDVDEKRQRGLDRIIETCHAESWHRGDCRGGFCPIWVDPFETVYTMPVEAQAERIIAHMEAELAENLLAEAVGDYAEYCDALARGRHAMLLGSEGLSYLHGDAGKLEALYQRKFRIFSLTWNEENEFAAGASAPDTHGLTAQGKAAVREIERLGAILDLAHSSRKTFFDAAAMATKPFVVSHGNVDALFPHPRNLTDAQLSCLREHGGVLGISAYGPFISNEPGKMTCKAYCDNIEYVADKIGVKYVGLGFDFVDFLDDYGEDESLGSAIRGLEGIRAAQNIADELAARGVSESDIGLIFHGNFERILKEVLS